jgi:hypothetical protein
MAFLFYFFPAGRQAVSPSLLKKGIKVEVFLIS